MQKERAQPGQELVLGGPVELPPFLVRFLEGNLDDVRRIDLPPERARKSLAGQQTEGRAGPVESRSPNLLGKRHASSQGGFYWFRGLLSGFNAPLHHRPLRVRRNSPQTMTLKAFPPLFSPAEYAIPPRGGGRCTEKTLVAIRSSSFMTSSVLRSANGPLRSAKIRDTPTPSSPRTGALSWPRTCGTT